jgi:hypothetical protein
MEATLRKIGPAEAQALLDTQVRNRSMRPSHVRLLARAMARNEWAQNGEPIKLDIEGRLLDGQHRLQAVIDSGKAFEMLVVDGLMPEAQETMDNGARRSLSDVLKLRGEHNTTLLAATLGVIWRIWSRNPKALGGGAMRPTPQELLTLLEGNPDICDYLQAGRTAGERVLIPASLTAALWYLFHQASPEDADLFFQQLRDGANLSEDSPIYLLRRFLERERASTRTLPRYRVAGTIIKAWNLWRRAETVQNLSFRAGGSGSEEFPEIDGLTYLPNDEDQAKAPRRPRRRTRQQRAKQTQVELPVLAGAGRAEDDD